MKMKTWKCACGFSADTSAIYDVKICPRCGQKMADVRLCEAAPDLLAACKRVVELAESGDLPGLRDWTEMGQLRSVIQKAEGEA